jgi:hypothetical protein
VRAAISTPVSDGRGFAFRTVAAPIGTSPHPRVRSCAPSLALTTADLTRWPMAEDADKRRTARQWFDAYLMWLTATGTTCSWRQIVSPVEMRGAPPVTGGGGARAGAGRAPADGGSTAAAQDSPFAVAFKIGWNRARLNPRPRRPGEGILGEATRPAKKNSLTKTRVARRRTGHVVPASPEIQEDRVSLSGRRTRPAKHLIKVSAAGNQHIP